MTRRMSMEYSKVGWSLHGEMVDHSVEDGATKHARKLRRPTRVPSPAASARVLWVRWGIPAY